MIREYLGGRYRVSAVAATPLLNMVTYFFVTYDILQANIVTSRSAEDRIEQLATSM